MSDDAFSPAQLAQISLVVNAAVRDAMGDAGLRLDGADNIDEARRDHMFMRSLRKGVNGAAAKIGWFFIAAVLGAVVWLVNSGLSMWKGS